MVKMRFYWEFEGKEGTFDVESYSHEECIEIAKEEIDKYGCDLVD